MDQTSITQSVNVMSRLNSLETAMETLAERHIELVKHMESLSIACVGFVESQQIVNENMMKTGGSYCKRCQEVREQSEEVNEQSKDVIEQPQDVAEQSLPESAGPRLVKTFELLENILLMLPHYDVLKNQRVDRQFRSVTLNSTMLQRKLYFAEESVPVSYDAITLNPLLTSDVALRRLPLFFDFDEVRLAYVFRPGRVRLSGVSANVTRDDTTGQQWVELVLEQFGQQLDPYDHFTTSSRRPLTMGSWKRMYLTQIPCEIRWRCTIRVGKKKKYRNTYTGTARGGVILDKLLEHLAESRAVRVNSSHDFFVDE